MINSNNGYNGNGNGVTFSVPNPILAVGQSTTVLITNSQYTSSNSYVLSNNSNSGIVTAQRFRQHHLPLRRRDWHCLNAGLPGQYYYNTGSPYYSNPNCGTLFVTVNNSGYNNGYPNNNYPGSVLGATSFANGTLIQEGQQISIVYHNVKTPFGNYASLPDWATN